MITAHWVDCEFRLQKRILNFCQITDHKGVAIGKDIEKCLDDWGIKKIFVVTVDNASSNERTVSHLKKTLSEKKGGIVLGGKFAHMRCCTHIVNLIVNEGYCAIPAITVASESAFSTRGRILDPFRSSLSCKTVETLIC